MTHWAAKYQTTWSVARERFCATKNTPKSERKKIPGKIPVLCIERADKVYEYLVKLAVTNPGEGVSRVALLELVGLPSASLKLLVRELMKNHGVIERFKITQKGQPGAHREYLVDPEVAKRLWSSL